MKGHYDGFLTWCGFPIVVCAFTLCVSAMWVGMARPGDLHYANIGGLVPFSDAGYYLAAAFDQVRDDAWNALALRRPLAAAFRSILLVFGGFSLQGMLLLQACLVAGAVCFASYAIIVWRGIWAGIAFFSLTYIYTRIFVTTTLTEPLGIFWALLSIPFFIEAFRNRSTTAALAAFAMTTVALMTRMGSMFTLPALLVWLVWQFGQGAIAKLRICAAAIGILLSVFGLNSLLQTAYGIGSSPSTGNFAHVLCGLSIGTTWDGCLKRLAEEGTPVQGGEDAQTRQLYSAAWKYLRADPRIFFQRLEEGTETFVTEYPSVMWKGYGRAINEPDWLPANMLAIVSLIGLLYGALRRAKSVELTFWLLLWTSIVASSSIVYLEDGSRALAASHPMMALFFALGMSNLTSAPSSSCSRLSGYGVAGSIVAAALMISVPSIAYYAHSRGVSAGAVTSLERPNEAFVFGGHRMSGFLVVADDQPLRNDIPSLHLAEFDAIIGRSSVEYYQDLIHPNLPPMPFGFVFTPRAENGVTSGSLYIVPAKVLEQRDVPIWHFDLDRWGEKHNGYGYYWFYAAKAEPWPLTDHK